MDIGRWALDAGHWTLDAGHWTLENRIVETRYFASIRRRTLDVCHFMIFYP